METYVDGVVGDVTESGNINGEMHEAILVHAEMEDDARSEATFCHTVSNVSKLKDSQLSAPCFVRNLPWKILVKPTTFQTQERQQIKGLGFFLECNGASESSSWSCNASAELRLLSQKDGIETFCRKTQHLFHGKESDWGFSHFMGWNEVLDPEKGFIKDDAIILEVHVMADAPHGVNWDSNNTQTI